MNDLEPTFDEYVAARKVLFYELEKLRAKGEKINVACDQLVANIVFKSSPKLRADHVCASFECGK